MDEVEALLGAAPQRRPGSLMVSYDGDPECAVMVDWRDLPWRSMRWSPAPWRRPAPGWHRGLAGHPAGRGGIVIVACRVRDDGAIAGSDSGQVLARRRGLRRRRPAAVSPWGWRWPGMSSGHGRRLDFQPTSARAPLSTFELTSGAAAAEHPDARAPAGRTAHILVVDDNATNRMVVEALCEMFECSTESVTMASKRSKPRASAVSTSS